MSFPFPLTPDIDEDTEIPKDFDPDMWDPDADEEDDEED